MKTINTVAIALCVFLTGASRVVGQADISVTPDSLDQHLLSGGNSIQQLSITNSGPSNLLVNIASQLVSVGAASAAESESQLLARLLANHEINFLNTSDTPKSRIDRQQSIESQSPFANESNLALSASSLAGSYSGDYLSFGLTDYGEIMPFQFPIGVEHLALGTRLSGYTIAYRVSGVDHLSYAANDSRLNIVPISYTEAVNTPSMIVVEVVTETSDNAIRLTHTFTFDRHRSFINIQCRIQNVSGEPVNDVVYKTYADWDSESMFSDNWDYDLSRNMIYAWNNQYVAMASNRIPDVMDIDGWHDYRQRETIVDFPTGPVFSFDGLEIIHHALENIASGATSFIETVYGAANTLAELQSTIDIGFNRVAWIHVNPISLDILPWTSRTVDIGFDATGLLGGNYLADLLVNSNDPDESIVRIPTHLSVTGVPEIRLSPSALDFTSTFVGTSIGGTVSIRNVGTEMLIVSNVVSSKPEFIPQSTSFTVNPGNQYYLPMTFAPGVAGQITAEVTIICNDPFTPTAAISVTGKGIDPPDIDVAPDSLYSSLFSGDTDNQTLTISNIGAIDLNWQIYLIPRETLATVNATLSLPLSRPNPDLAVAGGSLGDLDSIPWDATAQVATLLNLTGVRILFDQAHDNYFSSNWSTMISNLRDRGAVVTDNYSSVTSSILQNADIFWLGGNFSPWSPSEINTLKTWLNYGGSLLIDGGEATNNINAILSVLGVSMTITAQTPVYGETNNILPHEITTDISSVYLHHAASRITSVALPSAVIVKEMGGANNVAVSKIGSGRIVVVSDYKFFDWTVGANQNLLFDNQAFDWLAFGSASPITVDLYSGVIASGLSTEVTVTFDAVQRNGGDYLYDLAITSNDPDEPEVRVPAHLQVTGTPDITIVNDTLRFDSIYVEAISVDSIIVMNIGTDILTVTSVTSSNPDFAPGLVAFTIDPGEIFSLPISFSPSAAGIRSGVVTISSDDPDMPVASVYVTGFGVIPPDVMVSPDSLYSSLYSGATENQTLTISNIGATDLNWQISFIRRETLATVTATLSLPLSRPNPDPAVAGGTLGDVNGIPWNATTQLVTLLDLTGVRIFFDQAHGNYSSSNWSIMINNLTNRGAVVTNNYSLVTSSILQNADVFWLGGNISACSSSEINALKTWLTAGGSLLIDGGEATNNINAILSALGVGMTFTAQTPVYEQTNNILPHEITTGISSVYLHHAASRITSVALPSSVIVKETGGANNVAVTRIGAGRIVAVSDYKFFDWTVGSYQNLLFDNQAFDWLAFGSTAPMTVDIYSGVIASGLSTEVTVTFDAMYRNGGDYLYDLAITSNDPDEPEVRIPAHLHVTGAPDISVAPDTLSLGTIFVGYSSSLNMLVSNTGNDILNVNSVSSNNPEFMPSVTSFSVVPNAEKQISVLFSPTAVGARSGILTIFSNDPDAPTVSVVLLGNGLMPPVINVSPDSLDANLFTDAIQSQSLLVSNTGGSNLYWELDIRDLDTTTAMSYALTLPSSRPAGNSSLEIPEIPEASEVNWRTTAVQATLQDLSGVTILFDQFHGNYSPSNWQIMISNLQSRGASIVYNYSAFTGAVLQNVDIVWLVNHTGTWNTTELTALNNWISDGGGLLTEGALHINGFNSIFSAIGAGFSYVQQFESWGLTTDILPHATTNGVDQIYCHYAYARIANVVAPATVIMRDPSGADNVVYKRHSHGRIMAVTDYKFYDGAIGSYDNQLFANQVFDWLATKSSIMTSSAGFGTIAAGASTSIGITFDATDLGSSDYFGELLFFSNDSASSEVRIPAHMHVTGASNISVDKDSIDYGSIFVGYSSTDTIVVSNLGTDPLVVSSISSSNLTFVPSSSSLTVSPGTDALVSIVFAPVTPESETGSMTLLSNDPDMPVKVVSLRGQGLIEPDILVSPDSIDEHLMNGTLTHRTLTITNAGGSDLVWNLKIQSPANAMNSVSAMPEPFNDTTAFSIRTIPIDDMTSDRIPDESLDMEHRPNQSSSFEESSSSSSILVIQNSLSWGLDMRSFILSNFGFSATVITSSQIAATDFSSFDVIMTVGDQYSSYYSAISSNRAKFESFVSAGGIVQYQLATQGSNVSLVGGAQMIYGTWEDVNRVVATGHPIVTGLPSALYGNAANHCVLSNLPAGSSVITSTMNSGLPTTVEYSYGSGRVIATGMTWEFLWVYGYESRQLLYNAVDYSIGLAGATWLSSNMSSGVVPAASAATIDVAIDASRLNGGDYFSRLDITSNDPDQAEVQIPTHLHVTGIPDITVSASTVSFPTLFVGVSMLDTIEVRNSGTDLLVVTNIQVGNAHFTASPSSFSLAPGGLQLIRLGFAPLADGDLSTALTITSNDPDESMYTISLYGNGLFPPQIQLNPSLFVFNVNQSLDPAAHDTLLIYNAGRSDLIWSAQIRRVGRSSQFALDPPDGSIGSLPYSAGYPEASQSFLRSAPLQATLLDLTDVRILFDQTHAYYESYNWSTVFNNLRTRGATVVDNFSVVTSAVLQDADVYWIGGNFLAWTASEITALKTWLTAGGSLLIDGGEATNNINTILSTLGIGMTFTSQTPVYGVTVNVLAHEITTGIDSVYMHHAASRITSVVSPSVVIVKEPSGANNVVAGRIGAGRILAVSDYKFFNWTVGAYDNQLFDNQAIDWLGNQVDWLTIAPLNDTTPAGTSSEVIVHIDASALTPGNYSAAITVNSNDPVHPEVETLVSLVVKAYLCGDANTNGTVTTADLNYLWNTYFSCGQPPVPFGSGDINCDGKVNLADIWELERFLNGGWILDCCQNK